MTESVVDEKSLSQEFLSEKSQIQVAKPDKKVKKKKNAKGSTPITPEYIEEQRRISKLRKEQKRAELIAQGINPDQIDTPADLRFIERPMLKIPRSSMPVSVGGLNIKIMTYNLLAQALIRRKLFPTSGNALKWFKRSKVLIGEIKSYDADIMCLQEVDHVQFKTFWKNEFEKLGYGSKFHRADSKNHGICIVYKKKLFNLIESGYIDYDKEKSGDILPRTITRNVGLLTALEFSQQVKSSYPEMTKKGVIIGTTHLFWHPFGTFERSRQTYLVLKRMKEFSKTVSLVHSNGEQDKWFNLFAGDFNSQPFDAPYLSITSKPTTYESRAKKVIACSLSFQYSKLRGIVEDEEGVSDEEGSEEESEEGGNIEKFGSNQPKDPVPASYIPNEEEANLVLKMQNLHNSLDMRAISLYSVGYKSVHPTNAGRDNERNEPFFSNWAHAWRGLLDYIFLVKAWDINTNKNEVESLEAFEAENDVTINSLLRLPEPEEMGEEPSGQPREGQYPSDHLCLMADVTLKLT